MGRPYSTQEGTREAGQVDTALRALAGTTDGQSDTERHLGAPEVSPCVPVRPADIFRGASERASNRDRPQQADATFTDRKVSVYLKPVLGPKDERWKLRIACSL